MFHPLIACQQFAVTAPRTQTSSDIEAWQLVAGLEAIVIIVLLIGWLASVRVPLRIASEQDS